MRRGSSTVTREPFDPVTSLALHDAFGAIEEEFNAALGESLSPRGPEMLYDIVESLGLAHGSAAVDVGCGEGGHSIELARRFCFEVLGVDPLERHVAIAREGARDAGVAASVRFAAGSVANIPLADGSVELVWCRDVLSLVDDLDGAFREVRRVLKPSGRAITYQMFTTELLDPREAEFLLPTMGCVPESMKPDVVERAIGGAGLRIEECHVLGTEWGEFGQEQTGRGATKLIRAARLLRDPQRYIDRFGQANYDSALGDNHGHVWRMIGKLSDRVYVFARA